MINQILQSNAGKTASNRIVGKIVKLEGSSFVTANGLVTITSVNQSSFILTIKSNSKLYNFSVNFSDFATFCLSIQGLDPSLEGLFQEINPNFQVYSADINTFNNYISSNLLKVELTSINTISISSINTANSIKISYTSKVQKTNIENSDKLQTAASWAHQTGPFSFTPIHPEPIQYEEKAFRLGYVRITNPVLALQHKRDTFLDTIPTMREPGSLKRTSGRSYESAILTYTVQNAKDIKNEVSELLKMLSIMPFVSVEGSPFPTNDSKGDLNYKEVAVRNVCISTIDDYPNALKVTLDLDPFNFQFFCPPELPGTNSTVDRLNMDDVVCWPLVKLWADRSGKSFYNKSQFDGKFTLSFPDLQTSRNIYNITKEESDIVPISRDLDSLTELTDIIQTGKQSSNPYVHSLASGSNSGTKNYTIKVFTKDIWNVLVPDYTAGIPGSPYFVGLADWNKVDVSNLYQNGAQVGINSQVSISDNINDTVASNSNANVASRINWQNQIQTYILNQNGFSSVPATGDPTYSRYLSVVVPKIQAAVEAPWEYFSVILKVNPQNKNLFSKTLNKAKQIYGTLVGDKGNYASATQKLVDKFQADPENVYDISIQKDIVIDNITAIRSNNLSLMNNEFDPLPVHSYMGGIDANFVVTGKCYGTEAKDFLLRIKQEFDRRALRVYDAKFRQSEQGDSRQTQLGRAFLKVDNEIFQLLGVYFAMPTAIKFETIENQVDQWSFTITFMEYDPKLLRAEAVKFLETPSNSFGRILEFNNWFSQMSVPNSAIVQYAADFFALERKLEEEEIFPDLSLPTRQEVFSWLQAIAKFSNIYNQSKSNKNLTPLQMLYGSNSLQSFEKTILEKIIDWFPANNSIFQRLEWQSNLDLTTVPKSYAYCDPDFYVYYHKDHDFRTKMDDITNGILGPEKNLVAQGIDTNANPSKTGLRFHDTDYGITNVADPTFAAINPANVSKDLNSLISNAFPADKQDMVRQKYAQYEQELDKDPGRWWSTPNNIDSTTNFALNADQMEAVIKGGDGFIDPVPGSGNTPKYDPNKVPDEFFKNYNDKVAFLNVLKTKVKLNVGSTLFNQDYSGLEAAFYNTPAQNTLFSTIDFVNKELLQHLDSAYGDNGLIDLFTPPKTDVYNDVADIMDDSIRNKISPLGADDVTNQSDSVKQVIGIYSNELGQVAEKSFELLTGFRDLGELSYATRVLYVNELYNYVTNNNIAPDPSNQLSDLYNRPASNPKDIMIDMQKYIIADSVKYNLDPNIINGYFLKLDGFGTTTAGATPQPGNISNRAVLYTKKSLYVLKLHEGIDLFCTIYNKLAPQFNYIPSVTLLATQMMLSDSGIDNYVNYDSTTPSNSSLKPDTIKLLQSYSQQLAGNAYGDQAAKLIKELYSTVGKFADIMDLLNAGYLESARMIGTYLFIPSNQTDCYFNPFSPIILVNTNSNGALIYTAPTGNAGAIIANRTDVGIGSPGTNYDSKVYDPQAAIYDSRKLAAALTPQTDAAMYGMLYDLKHNSPFSKFSAAFPAFSIVIINEGFYWMAGPKKLWDQFYSRTGIAEIEVFRSRHIPGATCTVTFSNIFNNIAAYSLQEARAQQLAVERNKKLAQTFTSVTYPFKTIGELLQQMLTKTIDPEVIRAWQNNTLKQLAITPGARLHVRMGYGSNAKDLPIVFNGTVIDAPVVDGFVTLNCAGDGVELMKPCTDRLVKSGNSYAFVDGGALGFGMDPSNIVTDSLVSSSLFKSVTRGQFSDWSNGIAHFGNVIYDTFKHYPAEVQINIYAARNTVLEQGIPLAANYFQLAGLYNYDNDHNLISVSVDEPTPWKVIEVCRRACMDFVAQVEPFATRSTLFFGKWWWPLNYTYDESITQLPAFQSYVTGQPPQNSRQNISLAPDTIDFPISRIEFNSVSNKINQIFKVNSTNNQDYSNLQISFPDMHCLSIINAFISYFGVQVKSSNVNYYLPEPIDVSETGPNDFLQLQTYYNSNWGKGYITQPLKSANGTNAQVDAADFSIFTADGNTLRFVCVVVYYKDGTNSITLDIANDTDSLFYKGNPESTLANNKLGAYNSGDFQQYLAVNYLQDVNNLVRYLKWKTFTQAYFAHSGINLLSNEIRADSSKMVTDAYGIYKYNGAINKDSIAKTIIYSLDINIQPGDRKTMAVDTGILATMLQNGIGNTISRSIANYIPIPGVGEFIQNTPTTPAIENGVVMALVDQAKEMYQGQFSIFGQPTMKPRDLVLLVDERTTLKGPVFVKEVVHRMDINTGFVTIVKPDAVVLPHASEIGHQTIMANTIGILHRITGYMVLAAVFNTLRRAKRIHDGINKSYLKFVKNTPLAKKNQDLISFFTNLNKDAQFESNSILGKYGAVVNGSTTLTQDSIQRVLKIDAIKNTLELNGIATYSPVYNVLIQDRLVPNKSLVSMTYFEFLQAYHKQFNSSAVPQVISYEDFYNLQNQLRSLPAQAQEILNRNSQLVNVRNKILKLTSQVSKIKLKNGTTDQTLISTVQEYLTMYQGELKNNSVFYENAVRTVYKNNPELKIKLGQIPGFTNETALEDGLRFFKDFSNFWKAFKTFSKESSQVFMANVFTSIFGPYYTLATALRDPEVLKILYKVATWKIQVFQTVTKASSAAAKGYKNSIKTSKEALKSAGIGSEISEDAVKGIAAAAPHGDALKAGFTDFVKTVMGKHYESVKGIKNAEDAFNAAVKVKDTAKEIVSGARLAKYLGDTNPLTLILQVSAQALFSSFIDGLNARFKAIQVAKIYPLLASNIPYTAGLRGHQGAVIGDDPGWVQQILSNTFKPNGNAAWFTGLGLLQMSSMFVGIEVPDYGDTEQDQKWIKAYQQWGENNGR